MEQIVMLRNKIYTEVFMKWISINTQMPVDGKDVLIFAQKVMTGAYFGRFQLESADDAFGDDLDYNEETDEYFAPEGWYERSENNPDYSYVYISENQVTHWMESPPKPI